MKNDKYNYLDNVLDFIFQFSIATVSVEIILSVIYFLLVVLSAVPDIPLGPVIRGYEESAFVNFLEQSHDGTAGWPRYGGTPATGQLTH